MAINEFPTFSNDQDPEFKAHFEAAWEDVSERETPGPSEHGDHPEFETPPPADVEGQEFLEPERNQIGDPLPGEAPGVPELAIDLGGGIDKEGVLPLDLEGFEAPEQAQAGDPAAATSEPAAAPFLPWAFPIQPQAEEGEAPQEFAGPQVEDVGEVEEFAPQEAARYDADTYQSPGAAPDQPPADLPDYASPPPVPIDAMNNEDLFARVGWRVEPPRTANTFWYM